MELALVIPIVLMLFLGLFDAGRVFYAQNAIIESARRAVRVAVVSASYTQAKYDAIRSRAVTNTPGLTIAPSNVTGQTGSCPAGAADPSGTCFYPDQVGAGQRAVVNIAVPVRLITPVISDLLGGTITVRTQSVGLIQCTNC